VPGYGPSGPVNIAFLGEAPGSEEVSKLQPFIGPAGEFMEKGPCTTAKVWFRGSWLTNVIDRQPPFWNGKNNAINSPDAIECIEAQTDELWRELEWLVRSKHIKVLVALGGTATLALGIKEPITKVRGSVYEISLAKRRALTREELDAGEPADIVCVATLHPSGLKRNLWTKRSSGTMEDTLAVTDDLKKVQRLVETGYRRPVENFILRPSADEIVSWIATALTDGVIVAVDTESKGDIDLEPSKRQLTIIGLARDDINAISISLLEEDGLQTWTNGSLDRITKALNLLFTTGKLMMQNALHDVPLLHASGFDLDASRIIHDTLLLHHAVSPEDKHNLAYIVSRFGVTTYWKEDVEKKAFGKVYNLRDCVVLHQALPPLEAAALKVDPSGRLLDVYRNETMALLPSIIRMHEVGMGLDRKRLKMWQQFASSKLAAAELELRNAAGVHPAFNFKSEQDTQALFFGLFPTENLRKAHNIVILDKSEVDRKKALAKVEADITECEEKGRTETKKYAGLIDRRERLQTAERPAYYHEAVEFLAKYEGLTQLWPGISKWNGRKTDKKNRMSLSKKTYPEMLNFAFRRQEELNALVRPTPEHEAEKVQLSKFVSVTSTYGAYSRISHVVSTYYDFETWSDGRVHVRLLLQGTSTGRLASR
jgi:uracil-DNA glycosylase family 4